MDALTYLFSLASRNATAVAASTSSTSSAAAGAGWGLLRTAGASAGKGVIASGSGTGAATAWGMAKQVMAVGMVVLLWAWRCLVLFGGWMTPPQDSAMGLIPFIFRIAAFCIAMPFAVCIALDLIAYGIARTLHLSISARRVPRSPMSIPKEAAGLSDTET